MQLIGLPGQVYGKPPLVDEYQTKAVVITLLPRMLISPIKRLVLDLVKIGPKQVGNLDWLSGLVDKLLPLQCHGWRDCALGKSTD